MHKRKPEKRTKKRTKSPLGKLKYAKFNLKRKPRVSNELPDMVEDILKAVPVYRYIPSLKRSIFAPYSFGFEEYSRPLCWCKIWSWFRYWFLCKTELEIGGVIEKSIMTKRRARKAMEEIHASQMELRSVGGL